jgi:hypothetical protein
MVRASVRCDLQCWFSCGTAYCGRSYGSVRTHRGCDGCGISVVSRYSANVWMAASFCLALALTGCVLSVAGVGERGTDLALRVTARLSFLLFWPAYAGSAAAALFGSLLEPLKRHARNFGLAFASAHIVHLGLVAWLCWIGAQPSVGTFVFFGIAVVWTYLLAVLSIGRLHRTIGPKMWWFVSMVGLNYIAFAFAKDFLGAAVHIDPKYLAGYLPFVLLAVAGPVLRVIASGRRIGNVRPGPRFSGS